MHYFIIVFVIGFIIYKQRKIWRETKSKLKVYEGIFPENLTNNLKVDDSEIVSKDKFEKWKGLKTEQSSLKKQLKVANEKLDDANRGYELGLANAFELSQAKFEKENVEQKLRSCESEIKKKDLQYESDNEICITILTSINNYLTKNKNTTSDFNLIKDIVDRNCDAVEEEIQTQIPVPLYYGLIGTMAGILVGIGMLVFSGNLSDLMGSGENSNTGDGIGALMGGVALAMIGSIIGIWLTTTGSLKHKNIKSEIEKNKHSFLSWMQAELLPTLSSDTASAFSRMTENLANFNATFSGNTETLSTTLTKVNEATSGQAELLQQVRSLKIGQIATANISVYDKLKNCTDEIGHLNSLLANSTQYVERVKLLNEQLNESQEMLRLIKQMTQFFERSENGLQEVISKSIGSAQNKLNEAVEKFNSSLEDEYQKMIVATNNQTQKLEATLDEQNDVLKKRLNEFSTLVDEIKNLTAVKSSMEKLEKATAEQNKKIDSLVQSIRQLSEVKSTGGAITTEVKLTSLQRWSYIAIIAFVGIVLFTLLLLIIIALFGK